MMWVWSCDADVVVVVVLSCRTVVNYMIWTAVSGHVHLLSHPFIQAYRKLNKVCSRNEDTFFFAEPHIKIC